MNIRRLAVPFSSVAALSVAVLCASGCSSEPDAEKPENKPFLECGPASGELVWSQHPIGELSTMNIGCHGTKGPVVVFLHGFPDFAEGWRGAMKSLAANHIAIAPDQRGYHITAGPDGADVDGYKIDKLVADIKALIERLTAKDGVGKPGEITLVGHD